MIKEYGFLRWNIYPEISELNYILLIMIEVITIVTVA